MGKAAVSRAVNASSTSASAEDIQPLGRRQRAPRVAIADGVAPVALQGFIPYIAVSVGGVGCGRIADTILGGTRPRARSAYPTEQVDGAVGRNRAVTVDAGVGGGVADVVPLVSGDVPCPIYA